MSATPDQAHEFTVECIATAAHGVEQRRQAKTAVADVALIGEITKGTRHRRHVGAARDISEQVVAPALCGTGPDIVGEQRHQAQMKRILEDAGRTDTLQRHSGGGCGRCGLFHDGPE